MPIIEVNHVTKEYRLGQLQSLKHSLQRATAKLRGQAVPERPLFKALDDVDFKVEAGEVLGIIGHNGAGKSTLINTGCSCASLRSQHLCILHGTSCGENEVRGRIARGPNPKTLKNTRPCR